MLPIWRHAHPSDQSAEHRPSSLDRFILSILGRAGTQALLGRMPHRLVLVGAVRKEVEAFSDHRESQVRMLGLGDLAQFGSVRVQSEQ